MLINVYLMAILDNYMFRPPQNTTPIKREEKEQASS